jgi:glucuronoarabinoxylan endo-1,4-beta-xylanase
MKMEMQRSCQKANRFFQVVPIVAASAICLFLTQAAPAGTATINLNTEKQTIRGFGGMNFPRWGRGLTDAQVDAVFGNGPGQIGFTIMRIDVPPDNNASHWSLALSNAQRAINNWGAIVMATPWSPPPSMKTNGSTVGGQLSTGSYGAFASYLSDFANYFSSNGAPLYAVSIQNEPDISVTYESCSWTPTQMLNFAVNNASVIPTRVIACESYHFDHSYTDPILNDSNAATQVDIIAGHIYGGGNADYPLARSKGKEVWMTEHYTDSTNDGNVWPNALDVGKEIHDCMTNNMNAYIWWYICRFYGPLAEGGTTITKRGYCMSHFAKFARPGYVRVDATASPQANVYVTAYTHNSTLVIVAVNMNTSSQSVTFSVSGGPVYSYTKYETSSSNSLTNMGSVGSTDTLAASSMNTYVGTILYGDLNSDGKVDFKDFAILGQGWLTVYGWDTVADIADEWLYGT